MAVRLKRGDFVNKVDGYQFPGRVVSVYTTLATRQKRVVVEATEPPYVGFQHIFRPDQLFKIIDDVDRK